MTNIEDLLNIDSINIAGVDVSINLKEYLDVDSSNLKYEFERHTKMVAIAGFAYEQALANSKQLATELERVYALCDARARNEAVVNGNKKPTETMIDNIVKTSVEYQEKQQELHAAEKSTGILKVLRDAMNHRKDILVGLGANYRMELQSEPFINQGIK